MGCRLHALRYIGDDSLHRITHLRSPNRGYCLFGCVTSGIRAGEEENYQKKRKRHVVGIRRTIFTSVCRESRGRGFFSLGSVVRG